MILVTGGTGLVGAHLLLQLLRDKADVTATFRTEKSLGKVKKVFGYYSDQADVLFKKIKWVQADLNNIPALDRAFENVRRVYHCAALISFDPSDFKKLQKVNAEGTANIVNLCLDHNIEKLCYVSSIATIGSSLDGEPATEENFEPDGNASVYALSKFAAEMEIWRGAQEGLAVVIANPGIILGPGFWDSGSGVFFKMAARGMPWYPKGGTGFVGVSDVISCMAFLMKSTISNERFILVEEHMCYGDVLNKLATELGQTPPKKPLRKWHLACLWRLDWLFSHLGNRKRRLTKITAASLSNFSYYSNRKIKRMRGPVLNSLGNDIAISCAKYREERMG